MMNTVPHYYRGILVVTTRLGLLCSIVLVHQPAINYPIPDKNPKLLCRLFLVRGVVAFSNFEIFT